MTSREGLRHVAIMRSDEDGTILAHNNTRFRLVDTSKKGGNAPRAPDKMRDFILRKPRIEVVLHTHYSVQGLYGRVVR
jgi:hypothetical protein